MKNPGRRIAGFPFAVLICLSIALVLAGCGNTPTDTAGSGYGNQDDVLMTSHNYMDAIRAALSYRLNTGISTLTVTFTKKIQTGCVSQFLFTTSTETPYEGAVYATIDKNNGYTIQSIFPARIDQSVPFTQMGMSGGQINIHHRDYVIQSGVVNNKDIDYINIGFVDGSVAKVMVNETYGTYAYARDDNVIGIKYTEGFSKGGHLLYKY